METNRCIPDGYHLVLHVLVSYSSASPYHWSVVIVIDKKNSVFLTQWHLDFGFVKAICNMLQVAMHINWNRLVETFHDVVPIIGKFSKCSELFGTACT